MFCSKFNVSLRSLLKRALQCPKNLYSSVLHGPIYPNIINIFDNQLKAQASLFMAQANSLHTSHAFKFLMLLSQQKFLLPSDPFSFLSLFDYPL